MRIEFDIDGHKSSDRRRDVDRSNRKRMNQDAEEQPHGIAPSTSGPRFLAGFTFILRVARVGSFDSDNVVGNTAYAMVKMVVNDFGGPL